MPWKAALGAVAGDVAGALVGGAFSAHEASKNRAWQERMASTQYQRAAKDLEAAGLNRILALGSPASPGTGAQAAHPGPTPGSTGIAAVSARQQIRTNQALEELYDEQANAAHAEARLKHAEASWQEWVKDKAVYGGNTVDKTLQGAGTWLGEKAAQVQQFVEKGAERISSGSRHFKTKIEEEFKHNPILRWWRSRK